MNCIFSAIFAAKYTNGEKESYINIPKLRENIQSILTILHKGAYNVTMVTRVNDTGICAECP